LQELRQKYLEIDAVIFYATLSDILESIESKPILVSEDDKRNLQLTALHYATKQGETQSDISYFFCYQPFSSMFSLSSYLKHVAEEMPLTVKEKDLYKLLGDVNQDYLFHSFNKILTKFLDEKVVIFPREDIFLEALVKLDWLVDLGSRKYQLKIPLQFQADFEENLYQTFYYINFTMGFVHIHFN